MASAPRKRIDVKLTNTYKNSQKIAIIKLTAGLYLVSRNCGMVNILFLRYTGINQTATARPTVNPCPLAPINCSAEIFEAISEAPIAHQVSEPSARKKSWLPDTPFFFLRRSAHKPYPDTAMK